MSSVTPFLMFKKEAKEASEFYLKVFPNSRILSTSYFMEGEIKELERLPADQRPAKVGDVKVITMSLNGSLVNLGNGGSYFEFSHGISMNARCESQEQLDHVWNMLASEGGSIEECGWVSDKFGVPWQVYPAVLDKWLQDPDPKKVERVSVQILRSKKLVIEELRRAFEGN